MSRVMTSLTDLAERADRGVRARLTHDPSSPVVTAARSLMALGTAITLLANDSSVLFHRYDPAGDPAAQCAGLARIGAFCAAGVENGDVVRLILAGVLLAAAVGFAPRYTAPLQWYASFSVFSGIVPMDGGDQITAVLCFLLMIHSIADGRLWGWSLARRPSSLKFVFPNVLYLLFPLQLAVVYFDAGVAKVGSQPWAQGDAMWYWMQHPAFGAPDWLEPGMLALLANPLLSALATWGVLVFEISLAATLFSRHFRLRLAMLVAGIVFHIGIAVVIGLVSFAFAMSAGLVLGFIRSDESERVAALLHRALARRQRKDGGHLAEGRHCAPSDKALKSDLEPVRAV